MGQLALYAHSALRAPIHSMAIHPQTSIIGLGYTFGTIQFVKIPSLKRLAQYRSRAMKSQVYGLTWGSDGQGFYSINEQRGSAFYWPNEITQTPQILFQAPLYDDDEEGHRAWDYVRPISIACDPHGRYIACGDSKIKLWQVGDLSTVQYLRGHKFGINHLTFNRYTTALLSASSNKATLGLWEPDREQSIWQADTFDHIASISWDRSGTQVFCIGYCLSDVVANQQRSLLQIWNPWTQQLLKTVPILGVGVWQIAMHPQQPLLAIGHSLNGISLWNTETWELLGTAQSHYWKVSHVNWTSDGQWLVTCGHAKQAEKYGIEVWKWS